MSIKENVKVIGLTGMSGAGKSTACSVFKAAGFDIIDCDRICREIVEKGRPCLNEIAASFGNTVLTENGELDRTEMAKAIFGNTDKRLLLNGIMYPYVSYIVIKSVLKTKNSFTVLDAPTLFESGIDDICDYVVSVVAQRETLISRIMNRDNISREAAENRLRSQQTAEFYRERSDFIIENNGSGSEFKELIEKTVNAIKESK